MTNKFVTIIKREYMSRVRTKGFAIFTVLIPAIMAGYFFAVVSIAHAGEGVRSRMAVIDLSGRAYDTVSQVLDDKLPDGSPKYQLREVAATPATLPEVEADLRTQIDAGKLDAFLVLPADVATTRKAEYHTRNAAKLTELENIETHLRDAVTRMQLSASGLNPAQINSAFSSFHLDQLKVGPEGEHADSGQSLAVAYIFGILLYFTMLFFGMTVMRSVTEEKVSRVSELLLSSVDSFSLMLGKILGVAAVGLTQYAIWGVCLAGVTAYLAATTGPTGPLSQIPHVSVGLYLAFLVFFVLGFLVYSSLYAAVGAMVSSDQEAQQSNMPITMLLVVSFLLGGVVVGNPNSTLSVVASMFPFFAPILMMMRMVVSSPPIWQVATSILLCLLTLLGLAKATAKIYRVGILMTGKRPTLPELIKWLKYA